MKFIIPIILIIQILLAPSLQNEAEDIEESPRFDDSDANLNVPQIIAKYGYPVQSHEITTTDGYILTLHRIPNEGKHVVWLQHGLLGDSSSWIMNSQEDALAYALADAGFDIWLGNSRGNRYSRRHTTLDPAEEAFWDFSFHEMGIYDLPAGIDYVLNQTGQPDLFYFGHSEGTTIALVCAIERPEYNSKFRLMSLLAPIAYTQFIASPLNELATISNKSEEVRQLLGAKDFVPTDAVKELLRAGTCRNADIPLPEVCSNTLFLLGGYNSTQLDEQMINGILAHVPSGTSVRNIIHYAQGINSTLFAKFDYGTEKNREVYGQAMPPRYDTLKFSSPFAIFWAEEDWLSSSTDVYRITEELSSHLVLKYRINSEGYNNLDFIWAVENDSLFVRQVLELMEFFIGTK